jgi:hypothetical protein
MSGRRNPEERTAVASATRTAMLGRAGTQAPALADLALDPLVFDPDVDRRGAYGGFFLAKDSGADNYAVPDAPGGPQWTLRYNGRGIKIPRIHLPLSVRFAIVATGPLMQTAKAGRDLQYRFEAVVFCDQVIDRRTNKYALLRLAISGVPAVKLHQFMVLEIREALGRLTHRFRHDTRAAFRESRLSRDCYEAAMARSATPQFIWVPVSAKACQRLGDKSSTIGAIPFTDFITKRGNKRLSMWTRVSTDRLATPDSEGGLLLTGWVQKACDSLHPTYHRALRDRAEWKARYKRTRVLAAPTSNQAADAATRADD